MPTLLVAEHDNTTVRLTLNFFARAISPFLPFNRPKSNNHEVLAFVWVSRGVPQLFTSAFYDVACSNAKSCPA